MKLLLDLAKEGDLLPCSAVCMQSLWILTFGPGKDMKCWRDFTAKVSNTMGALGFAVPPVHNLSEFHTWMLEQLPRQ
jgi:hypothetical protein